MAGRAPLVWSFHVILCGGSTPAGFSSWLEGSRPVPFLARHHAPTCGAHARMRACSLHTWIEIRARSYLLTIGHNS